MIRTFETGSAYMVDALKDFLHSRGIVFECSGGTGFWHFEIFCNGKDESRINKWLGSHSVNSYAIA